MLEPPLLDVSLAQSVYRPVGGPAPRSEMVARWLAGEPLVPPAVGLAAGIFLDSIRPIPFFLCTALLLSAGAVLLRARRGELVRYGAVALAAVAVGAVLHDLDFRRWPNHHLVRYTGAEPVPARVTGVVVQTPSIVPHRTGRITWMRRIARTRLLIDADTLEGAGGPIHVRGLAAVTVGEPLLGVCAGDRVTLLGSLRRPEPPANPGERDWPLINRRKGVLVEMSCEHAANVTVLAAESRYARWLNAARRRACAAMREGAFDEDTPGARLLEALVLGQRSAVDEDLNQAFVNTGTVHYLSVSGAHVGVLVAFVWLIGRLLGRARRECALWAAALVIAYALLTEPSPAVTRSAIMAVVFCVTVLARRPLRSANGLAAAAIILLVIQPTQLFDPGFQLSFFTLMAIMYLAPRVHAEGKWVFDKMLRRDDPLLQPAIQRMLNPPSRPRLALDFCIHKLGWALALSTAAWAVGALISVYHFRQVPPWGWLNTVLITIPMSAVLLLGLAKTAISIVLPPASVLLGWPLSWLTDFLIKVVGLLNRLPGSGYLCPEVPAWLSAVGLASLGLWVLAPPLRVRGRWVAGAMASFVMLTGWSLWPGRSADTLRLHVLSVGHGAACILQAPGGGTLIYDLGTRPPYDMQRWTIGPFLAREHIYSIDRLILSHAELDHFSGIPGLLDKVRVRGIVTTPYLKQPAKPGTAAERLVADLRARDIPWRTAVRGERIEDGGGALIEVLWPPRPEELQISDPNNSSLVLRITHAGRRILLCGDIEEPAQRQLMRSDIAADVLVLPHHGGVCGATKDFIAAVNPSWCIRSSGRRDRNTTNGLIELVAGRQYFNTADRGAVQVRIGPGGVSVLPFR